MVRHNVHNQLQATTQFLINELALIPFRQYPSIRFLQKYLTLI
jgi:hypothetical protein